MMTRDEAKWLQDARDEIAQLKRQLRAITGDADADNRRQWHMLGLTPAEERICRVLLLRDLATHEALEAAVYWDKRDVASSRTMMVFLSHIRKKLPFLRPWLKSVSGRGYALHAEGKHRLLFELMNPEATRP